MKFDDDELGTIQAALASFSRILEDVDAAKANGFVPPCFNPNAGSRKGAVALLEKIARRSMN